MNVNLQRLKWMCRWIMICGLVAATLVSASHGQSLHFDVSPVVACHPAEDLEFSESVPGEKLIEARCQVSVLVTDLTSQSLRECLFHFFSPEPHTRVHDYFPKTLLVTDVLGSVRIQQSQDRAVGAEAKVGTTLQGAGAVELGGSMDRRHAFSLAYDRLPPMETLTAVGTLGRGSGVYFKQRQTTQNSLEGSREFILVLRVPQAWSAGYLRLVCQARTSRQEDGRDAHLAAMQSFLVPLYAAGDLQAKQAALDLQGAESELWNEVLREQESIRRASRPTVVHELSLVDPLFPEDWLSQVVRNSTHAPPLAFERRLPRAVQTALEQYRHTRQAFDQLAGAGETMATPTPAS